MLREAPAEPSRQKPQHQPTAVGKLMGEPDPTAAPEGPTVFVNGRWLVREGDALAAVLQWCCYAGGVMR